MTAHSNATRTLQQLRSAVGYDRSDEYLIHDRDSVFAHQLDESIATLGIRVLKSPPRSPMAATGAERT